MECPFCKNTEHSRAGKYYGKYVTMQRYQCRKCRSYFREKITHKGIESETSEPAGNNQEE